MHADWILAAVASWIIHEGPHIDDIRVRFAVVVRGGGCATVGIDLGLPIGSVASIARDGAVERLSWVER